MERMDAALQREVADCGANPLAFAENGLREAQESARLREELELIGYLASHDLVDPLRRIIPYCEILEQQAGPLLESGGRDALHAIAEQTARMKTLMQGLMEYLRLETFIPSHAMIHCAEVADAVLAELQANIQSAGAHVTIGDLPVVKGHRGRLMRLFTNLVDNALKFKGERPLKVHISARRVGRDWEFSVEDNGIGIDEEYSDIIFRLYQKLNETSPGEGVGLALCRKIVESHGGRMGVESSPGEGSRFYFTLPYVT